MSISIKKYVDITSGVGAGNVIRERELIGRIFTDNPRVPVDGLVEVTNAADARAYFGADSEEASRATFYFSFISKNIVAPRKLQFARNPATASAPRVYGARLTAPLSSFQAVAAGTLDLTMGANTNALTGLNFTSATSFADVASTLQTAIRAATGTQFTSALVAYDAVTQTFNLTGTVAEDAPISVASGSLATLLGWGLTAVLSPGTDVLTPVEALDASAEASNNFGSFLFMDTLTDTEVVELAEANAARNVEFMFTVRVDDTNAVSLAQALLTVAGVTLTYAPVATQWDEMAPMIVMAATDYTKRNAVQNYMFQQFPGLTPKVTTTAQSNDFDALRVNYYGNTQTAGQQINFYQRGVMGGLATALVDQNIYANELWLKDAAAANILSLLLSVGRVPANLDGTGQIVAILQGVIDRALFNGTISVGKSLTVLQQLYVTQMTDDELAWHQVQDFGYWINCVMAQETTTDGRVEYKATYTLIYAKDDAVRKVEGTHVLI
jgi:hypothetical protein